MDVEKAAGIIMRHRDETGEPWLDTLCSPEIKEFLNNVGYEAWYTPSGKMPFMLFPKGTIKAISKGVS